MEIDRTLSTPAIGRRSGGVRRLSGDVFKCCEEADGRTVEADPLACD